ncbi:MAG: NACHT domain-containing protein [Leptolyngbya sp. Prado105]|jgi:hypothetical protein|nr:NACHT domain-containing protein [Leptolyngbya sp. Prado105]
MKWFLRFLRSSLRESRQAQTLKDSSVTNSTIHQTQAGRDALSFPNAEQVLVIYNGWFGSRQIATGVDWDWAGRVIKEQRAEVRNRLKYVLRDRAPMTVELSEQPERVNLPALESQKKLTIAGQDSESLDPGKLMIEVFGRDDIDGKLLILGTPGAGKTTVLLSLAEQLLAGANTQACAEGYDNSKTVIPIVFELSTWKNDDQSIRDWLIEQLYDLYGGDRKLKRYEQWLEQQVLLPLLDGLDELGMERQQGMYGEAQSVYSAVSASSRVLSIEGIWNSLRNLCFSSAVLVSLGIFFIVLLIVIAKIAEGRLEVSLITSNISAYAVVTLIVSLIAIPPIFICSGGQAFIQHFCLRFVLAYSGTFPFFCIPFLNYCNERRLLQPIGGRYRFIHRELLEHFAKG